MVAVAITMCDWAQSALCATDSCGTNQDMPLLFGQPQYIFEIVY
jgi:hypothetical protein